MVEQTFSNIFPLKVFVQKIATLNQKMECLSSSSFKLVSISSVKLIYINATNGKVLIYRHLSTVFSFLTKRHDLSLFFFRAASVSS